MCCNRTPLSVKTCRINNCHLGFAVISDELNPLKTIMSFKIYVINLARSEIRLTAMTEKLSTLGLPFQRIDAVDGRLLSDSERLHFASLRPRDGRSWTPGAIGCFSSHYACWTEIANASENYGVVFEDDVHISKYLPKMLTEMESSMEKIDVLRLEGTRHLLQLDAKKIRSLSECRLQRVKSESWGAGGYIISKNVAAQLIGMPTSSHSPVDFFLFDKASSIFAKEHFIYQTAPALCVQSKFDDRSVSTNTHHGSLIEHNAGDSRLRSMMRKSWWKVVGLSKLMRGFTRVELKEDLIRL